VRLIFVLVSVMVTLALATAAPEESETVPRRGRVHGLRSDWAGAPAKTNVIRSTALKAQKASLHTREESKNLAFRDLMQTGNLPGKKIDNS